ncbi:hypothetical protein A3Q56_03824 [Intoshia linei]|uniref:Protein kinase domain-containing protein n=1 Tax=Intoshia linei TaxID=1819745 RepID=A0A177B289_9BILA|nr:hypothetical protein A3Q56_03824 [Intoshia linei]
MTTNTSHSAGTSIWDMLVGDKNQYRLIRKIGGGSFGDIYLAVHIETRDEVAVKLESQKARHPQLLYESRIYRILQPGIGIPTFKWFGLYKKEYNILIMELLGPSLEDLFHFCSRQFSLKTVLMLTDQMIARVEHVHSKHIIHR